MEQNAIDRQDMTRLRPEQLVERIRECPTVYIPSGIYEWHDWQNPLGTDTLKMAEICRRAAAITGGLVHMPSYIGVGAFYGPMDPLPTGGINFSEELVTAYLVELLDQLDRLGFELIVLLYGHTNPGNINAHDRAASDHIRREGSRARVLCLNDCEPATKHRYKVADHAAKWETSFMMAAHPETVDMDRIPASHGDWWGLDPRVHASAAEGERMYDLVVRETARLVEAARAATREQIADGSFVPTQRCYEDCQNIRDLREGYWGGDERWEDPCCPFCMWCSPGVVRTLAAIRGAEWTGRRIALWREMTDCYIGPNRRRSDALSREWEEVRGADPPDTAGR